MAQTSITNSNQVLTVTTPALPSYKFTLDMWHLDNQSRHRNAKEQQKRADRISFEAKRMCESVAGIVKANKEETDHQLREKLNDIEFRKKELLRIRKDVALEIDGLLIYKQRFANTLASVKRNALEICKKCFVARERRLGTDLVHDDVEKELMQEYGMIQEAENLLTRVLEETCEQIRKLKATLYHIDHDHKNKEHNLHIDRRNAILRETDFNLSTCQGTLHPDASMTINEWEQLTNNNVIDANKEMNGAKQLRSYIDTVIKQTINGLNGQKDATNKAFKRRVEQTQEAKTKLELRHSEIVKQIAVISSSIVQIKDSIADKEGYVALVEARLESRCQRPEAEVTRDLAEASLAKEVYVLRKIVANMQQMLCEAETSLRYLLKTQVQLEEDINIKANTLQIDDVECTILRQSMEYHAY